MSRVVDVGVVIPCFNGKTRGFVFQAVDSVLAQTVRPARFLVVDDGSTDGTSEALAARYPELEIVRKPNGGLPTARNCALRLLTNRYVAFLDDDDVWEPAKLATQFDFLEAHPEIGLVFCGVRYVDAQGAPFGRALPARAGLGYPEILFGNSLLPPSTVTFRRTLIDLAGPFDETLKQGEDYEYFIRCAKHGRLAALDDLHVHYRQHAQQMSASLVGIDEATMAIIERHVRADFPATSGHFLRFFAYGASARALLRRDFAVARRFALAAGGFWPWTYLLRLIGVGLSPLRALKGAWRRFEHRRVLRMAGL